MLAGVSGGPAMRYGQLFSQEKMTQICILPTGLHFGCAFTQKPIAISCIYLGFIKIRAFNNTYYYYYTLIYICILYYAGSRNCPCVLL